MAWVKYAKENSNLVAYDYDTAIDLDTTQTLDPLTLPAGRKRVWWTKTVNGTPNSASSIVTMDVAAIEDPLSSVFYDTSGTGAIGFFSGGTILSSMNPSGGSVDNEKQTFMLTWGTSTFIDPLSMEFPPFACKLGFQYNATAETGGATYDLFRILVELL